MADQYRHEPIVGYKEEIRQLRAELALLQSQLPALVADEVKKQLGDLQRQLRAQAGIHHKPMETK